MSSGGYVSLTKQLDEAVAGIRKKCDKFPEIVMVLGSGLNGLVESLEKEVEIPYPEIPHFKSSTVQGHAGKLVIGSLNGTRVAVMQGRLHYFEGYSMHDVVFPVRTFGRAGAKLFVLTNASGGLHHHMTPSDLVLLKDHINLMGDNPLIGANDEGLGPRFPDLTHLYDPKMNEILLSLAKKLGIKLTDGVYVAIHGPSYETPAEIRSYRQMGGDLVGMSTVPEAIAIRHMGKKVIALSCVTNLAAGVTTEPLNHTEVIDNAKKAYSSIVELLSKSLPQLMTEVRSTL